MPCPLCNAPDAHESALANVWVYVYRCERCGTYGLERQAAHNLHRLEDHDYARLSAVTREQHIKRKRVLLVDGRVTPVVRNFETLQVREVLDDQFPRTINERLDRTLLNLSRMSAHLGDDVGVTYQREQPVFFAVNAAEMHYTIQSLNQAELIVAESQEDKSRPEGNYTIQLTPKGWNRVADLEAQGVGESLDQVFVAMWFGNEQHFQGVPSSEFCTDAYREGLKVGIEQAGYSPRRIDFKEFNDDVIDEILAEIRRSRFVVADFTGHRAGVYFEAGFAKGLGLPVVFTCHKSEMENAHFDTSHYNHIGWSSFGELATKLENRIVATIGNGPHAQTGGFHS